MLARITQNIWLIFFSAAILIVAAGLIWAIIKARKSTFPYYKRTIIYSLVSIGVAAASWIFNFGWFRFILTIALVPIVHGTGFFVANLFFAKYMDKSPKLIKLNMFFVITYLLAYVLMPDGGDVGGMCFFFGLIHNDKLFESAYFLSLVSVVGHIVLFVMQIIEIRHLKNDLKTFFT